MGRQLKFLVGIAIIVGTVGFLVWTAVDQTKMYMITVSEFLGSGNAYANSTVRIAGKVAPGSMVWNAEKRELLFTMVDMAGIPGEVKVHFAGLLPDMFAEDRNVVVEGPFSDATPFEARAVLTSCPSKYQAKDGGTAPGYDQGNGAGGGKTS
ncbi:MAG TPA: cytochrome c maturation protein CcmE [Candidatus Binatia bacterium]|jgi:cytochrome c-type biogenesis protein CcmE